jgi:Ca2+-binding EF-hand superfamily protein
MAEQHGVPGPTWDRSRGPPSECPPVSRIIERDTYHAIAGYLLSLRDPDHELNKTFDLFDVDGKGFITISDIRRVSQEIGHAVSEEEMQQMIEQFDFSGKGSVSRDEFKEIFSSMS